MSIIQIRQVFHKLLYTVGSWRTKCTHWVHGVHYGVLELHRVYKVHCGLMEYTLVYGVHGGFMKYTVGSWSTQWSQEVHSGLIKYTVG